MGSKYPAVGITKAGYTELPMLCVADMPVEGSLARCTRILVFENKCEACVSGRSKKLRPYLSD